MNTNVQQAGVNQYFLTLEDAQSINHVVVFLTGQVPFSEGFGGSIYFGWPAEGGVSWQLLGFITNDKPSAIFKITKVNSLQFTAFHAIAMHNSTGLSSGQTTRDGDSIWSGNTCRLLRPAPVYSIDWNTSGAGDRDGTEDTSQWHTGLDSGDHGRVWPKDDRELF